MYFYCITLLNYWVTYSRMKIVGNLNVSKAFKVSDMRLLADVQMTFQYFTDGVNLLSCLLTKLKTIINKIILIWSLFKKGIFKLSKYIKIDIILYLNICNGLFFGYVTFVFFIHIFLFYISSVWCNIYLTFIWFSLGKKSLFFYSFFLFSAESDWWDII